MEAEYIYFGTPLGGTDEVGDPKRRRFHGAFTGGFSAGYFNTVGSAKGWTPGSFKSSRTDRNRDLSSGNTVEDYLDDDELEELREQRLRRGIQARSTYDTFGDASIAMARREMEGESDSARMLIVPKEFILPVLEGIGSKLLQASGYSYRHSGAATREAISSRPFHNKNGHGLGYDPFAGAEEFRNARTERYAGFATDSATKKRERGIAFGVGALEEDDSYGILDDYVDMRTEQFEGEEVAQEKGEEWDRHNHPRQQHPRLGAQLPPPSLPSGRRLHPARQGLIPGFIGASNASLYRLPYFSPPSIPPDYVPVVDLPAVSGRQLNYKLKPATQEVSPPKDEKLKKEIDRFAFFVARHGLTNFESLAKSMASSAPFLRGGEGSDYYAYKVSRLLNILQKKSKGFAEMNENPKKVERAQEKMLGAISEADLQALKKAINSTFVRAGAENYDEMTKTKIEDNAETEADKKEEARRKIVTIHDLSRAPAIGGIRDSRNESLPVRRTEEWKPAPLLCKRLDVPEPSTYVPATGTTGNEPSRLLKPSALWRVDALELSATKAEALTKAATAAAPGGESFLVPPSLQVAAQEAVAAAQKKEMSSNDAERFLAGIFDAQDDMGQKAQEDEKNEKDEEEIEKLSDFAALNKPLDLFKAIFEEESEAVDVDREVNDGLGTEHHDNNASLTRTKQDGVSKDRLEYEEHGNDMDNDIYDSRKGEKTVGFAKLRKQVEGSTEMERRIQEAFQVIEKSKRSKRRKKDRSRQINDQDEGGSNEEEKEEGRERRHRRHNHRRRRHTHAHTHDRDPHVHQLSAGDGEGHDIRRRRRREHRR
jgi:hypothetical protein